jgi:hypothetical protein
MPGNEPPEEPMQDFAAMTMYKLATHHTAGATAMYESQFTARAETYTDHDRRTADATTAPALVTLVQAVARLFHRRAVSHAGATVTPIAAHRPSGAAPAASARPSSAA